MEVFQGKWLKDEGLKYKNTEGGANKFLTARQRAHLVGLAVAINQHRSEERGRHQSLPRATESHLKSCLRSSSYAKLTLG